MIEIRKQFEPWTEQWKQIIKYIIDLLGTKKYRNPIILHIKKQEKRKEMCLVIEIFQKMNYIIESLNYVWS